MLVRNPIRSTPRTLAPPRLLRLLYAVSIPAFAALVVWHGNRLLEVATASAWIATALGCVAGSLAADVVTGGVHWACDTWGSQKTPVVGASLIRSFREHHTQPLAMLDHDSIEVNGEATTAATAAFALLAFPASQAVLAEHPFFYGLAWSLISFSALANQLHQWAHAAHLPRVVRMLQRIGLVLTPVRHARHHSGAHTSGYCITTGWMNPMLDAIGFWRALERGVSTLTGAEPRRHEGAERGAERDRVE